MSKGIFLSLKKIDCNENEGQEKIEILININK